MGAAIGAIAGFAAGMIRKYFIKGATEKAREKIKAIYGVDDSGTVRPDKAIFPPAGPPTQLPELPQATSVSAATPVTPPPGAIAAPAGRREDP